MARDAAAAGWAMGCATVTGAVALALGNFCLNIWNVVICAKAIGITTGCAEHSHLLAFLIGSIVCSALTFFTGGFTVPVLQIVFAILGRAWSANAVALCGASLPPMLLATVSNSIFVLWFTFASNVFIMVGVYLIFCIFPLAFAAFTGAQDVPRRPLI